MSSLVRGQLTNRKYSSLGDFRSRAAATVLVTLLLRADRLLGISALAAADAFRTVFSGLYGKPDSVMFNASELLSAVNKPWHRTCIIPVLYEFTV